MKTIIKSIFLFAFSLLATTWFLSGTHQTSYFRFLETVIPVVIMYISFMLISVLISYGYLKYKFSSQILKETHQVQISFWVVSALKIALILILLFPIIEASTPIIRRSIYLNEVNGLDDYLETRYIESASINMEGEKYKGAAELINQKVYNQDYFYFNQLETSIKYYQDEDTHYKTSSDILIDVNNDFIIINTRYLEEVLKLESRVEDYDEVYILASKNHDIKDLKQYNINHQVFLYEEDVIVLPTNSSGHLPGLGILQSPVIIVDNNGFSKYPSLTQSVLDYGNQRNFKAELDEIGKQYGLNFTITDIKGVVRLVLNKQKEDLFLAGNLIFVFILMFPIFTYSSIKLYLSANGKDLVVEYMNGYTYFQRYSTLIISIISSSFIALALLYGSLWGLSEINYLVVSGFSLYIIIVDLLMIRYSIKSYERHSMPQILKGEN